MLPSSQVILPVSSFTRPADTAAYADGDLVANSTTAGSVTPLNWPAVSGPGRRAVIRRVHLTKSGSLVASASFLVHFYAASPTPANGDNGAWSTDAVADYLGNIAVTVGQAFTDGAWGAGAVATGQELALQGGASGLIYGLVEATAAYTPASAEVFTVRPEIWRL